MTPEESKTLHEVAIRLEHLTKAVEELEDNHKSMMSNHADMMKYLNRGWGLFAGLVGLVILLGSGFTASWNTISKMFG